jgi:hypothetical protein
MPSENNKTNKTQGNRNTGFRIINPRTKTGRFVLSITAGLLGVITIGTLAFGLFGQFFNPNYNSNKVASAADATLAILKQYIICGTDQTILIAGSTDNATKQVVCTGTLPDGTTLANLSMKLGTNTAVQCILDQQNLITKYGEGNYGDGPYGGENIPKITITCTLPIENLGEGTWPILASGSVTGDFGNVYISALNTTISNTSKGNLNKVDNKGKRNMEITFQTQLVKTIKAVVVNNATCQFKIQNSSGQILDSDGVFKDNPTNPFTTPGTFANGVCTSSTTSKAKLPANTPKGADYRAKFEGIWN